MTGVWNVVALDPDWASDHGRTVLLKIGVVVVSGLSAFVHSRARSKAMLAAFGALSALSALAALFLGVLLG